MSISTRLPGEEGARMLSLKVLFQENTEFKLKVLDNVRL